MDLPQGVTVCTCEYCGTKQTLPKLDSDKRANLYDRANHFRRNNDFDKAMAIYESILNEDASDAEAYWSIVLCRYGIEYVEDPSSHKRIPTVNRAQFTSVLADEDYKSALKYSDTLQKTVYEAEAKAIDDIQKGILEISSKEEPFDVFICYKETDANGRRTPDSVLANDLYHQLTQEGFKVFFSRITLEDKLGQEYEPYIFAALNSAKVMVALGTKPEYFNAVWVKNEWSRYLTLIRSGKKKMLIPAFRDMDPYDLPEEFSHLQAQDMSKLGFMQDLIRGIKKILDADAPKPQIVQETKIINNAAGAAGSTNIDPLLKRVFMFLEDGDFKSANEYCERVLDVDPENAQAYLGKLMAELHIKRETDMTNCAQPFDNRNNYQKALRFGDEELQGTLTAWTTHIKERNETARKQEIYNQALSEMRSAKSENSFKNASYDFGRVSGYKDADKLAKECLEKAEINRKDEIYNSARQSMNRGIIAYYEAAIKEFQKIPGWKDADRCIAECCDTIERMKSEAEKERKEAEYKAEKQRLAVEKTRKQAKIFVTVLFILVLLAGGGWWYYENIYIPDSNYKAAIQLKNDGKYEEAISAFTALESYKDSAVQINACKVEINKNKYQYAISLYESGKYEEAINAFKALGSYRDSSEQILNCENAIKENKYQYAISLYETGKYEEAISAFIALGSYKDSATQITACQNAIKENSYQEACDLKKSGKYSEAYAIFSTLTGYKDVDSIIKNDSNIAAAERKAYLAQFTFGKTVTFGTYEQDNNKSNGKEDIEWLVLANDGKKALLISKYGLDCQQYNTKYTYITWVDCTLRTWLNNEFYQAAFSTAEQKQIITPNISDKETKYSTDPGKATQDKVFLLSIAEAEKYFNTDEARKCAPTAYAKAQGASTSNSFKTADGAASCRWWLRSPGNNQFSAAVVLTGGSLSYDGNYVDRDYVCVRPALWINLES